MKKKIILITIISPIILFIILNFGFPGFLYNTIISIERSLTGYTLKTVNIDNHKINYLEGGKGETILLIHGFNADKDNWTRFARHLTSKYHVVALDLPGFGDSTRDFKVSYTTEKQAERISMFAEKIGLKKFHIAGNSMGGEIAGTYAYIYPDKVITLGLFNAAGVHSPVKNEFAKFLDQGENVLVVNKPEDYIKLMNYVFVNVPFITESIQKYLGTKNLKYSKFNDKVFKEIHAGKFYLEKNLAKVKAKTLIVWGDTDRILDISMSKVFKKGIKNSRILIMKNCGHLPMLELPEETANKYLQFLNEKRVILK